MDFVNEFTHLNFEEASEQFGLAYNKGTAEACGCGQPLLNIFIAILQYFVEVFQGDVSNFLCLDFVEFSIFVEFCIMVTSLLEIFKIKKKVKEKKFTKKKKERTCMHHAGPNQISLYIASANKGKRQLIPPYISNPIDSLQHKTQATET